MLAWMNTLGSLKRLYDSMNQQQKSQLSEVVTATGVAASTSKSMFLQHVAGILGSDSTVEQRLLALVTDPTIKDSLDRVLGNDKVVDNTPVMHVCPHCEELANVRPLINSLQGH